MLTKPLIRARVRGDRIVPELVDTEAAARRELAELVLELYQEHAEAEAARGDLDDAIDELCSERRDHRLARGFAKVCADRATFASEPPVDPVAFRREVFLAARAAGPLSLEAGKLDRPVATVVLEEVGRRHGLDVVQAGNALYADLRESHRLLSVDIADASELLDRYNVALVQSLLLRAERMVVTLTQPTTPRIRQLLRWVRFHQLIATVDSADDRLTVAIDGPMSLFRQSSRYGKNLASFLPALLLQERWRLEATVLWTKRKLAKKLQLTDGDGLVSFRADTGAYKTREQTYFEERFAEHDTDWTLAEGRTLVPLGARRVAVPDYTLRRDDQEVHLQLVGFWRKETLQAHLEAVAEHAPRTLLVAVSKKLGGDKGSALPPGATDNVVTFAQVLSPKQVVEAAERAVAGAGAHQAGSAR